MRILRASLQPLYTTLSKSKAARNFFWRFAHSLKFHDWTRSHPCTLITGTEPDGPAAVPGSQARIGRPRRISGIERRRALWSYVSRTCDLAQPINYLEFGVYQGLSIRWWVEHNKDPGSRFVGFDCFVGLPEDWDSVVRKGHFSTQGRAPEIPDERCRFEVGYFNATLPKFVERFPFDQRLVVHLDADIYSSTLYVLCLLHPYLKAGDVLIFDEFSDHSHEFRAFVDFVSAFDVKFVPIANACAYWHFALQIQ